MAGQPGHPVRASAAAASPSARCASARRSGRARARRGRCRVPPRQWLMASPAWPAPTIRTSVRCMTAAPPRVRAPAGRRATVGAGAGAGAWRPGRRPASSGLGRRRGRRLRPRRRTSRRDRASVRDIVLPSVVVQPASISSDTGGRSSARRRRPSGRGSARRSRRASRAARRRGCGSCARMPE